jgi:hypothetical protein
MTPMYETLGETSSLNSKNPTLQNTYNSRLNIWLTYTQFKAKTQKLRKKHYKIQIS